ncbi:MAG TPA: MFS transporter [Aurantimonas coralicida]|uniref:Major facilitator superfamily (MFS) profile domain-containing protein n=1 Tax=marine sediment metagenome TaxID=412755 RepID=A0A0F9T861_9ZZZZ|nr:MFS transporter [Aurantimonas coralicida]
MIPASDSPPYRMPLRHRPVWGWMAFDFAAQPFFTVIITFVFGPYFVSQLAPDPATGQAWWSGAVTLTGIVVALLSPFLGSIADRAGPRKPWIASFAVVQIGALSLLWFAAPGSPLVLVALLIVLAQISAEFSIVFNDAMIPRLVHRDSIGRVSNIAWGLGYAGGITFLFFTLAFLAGSPATGRTILGLQPLFGLDPAAGEGARATGPLAALWYLVFVLPMFLFTPDRPKAEPITVAARDGLKDLLATWREIRTRPALFRFLIARMIYQDGVSALLVLGGAFAAGMFGWSITESGLFGIILNVTAILGCLAASVLDARLGSKAVITASILCLIAATIGIVSTAPGFTAFGLVVFAPSEAAGLFATAAEKSYIAWGLLIGLAFGPVQASSRSWLAQAVTADEAGRYFGFYALTGRATSFLATGAVAVFTAIAAALTDPVTASRIGMSAIILFLIVGLALLRGTSGPVRARDRQREHRLDSA